MSRELKLKRLSVDHANELFSVTQANRNYLREWLPWLDAVQTPADTLRFIEGTIEQFESGRGPQYGVFWDKKLCGVVGFHSLNEKTREGSIGYWLSENCTGSGIMTEAVQELLRVGFKHYHLAAIEIHCAAENVRSRKIPERLGARLDRIVKDAEWLYDRHVDHAVYRFEPTTLRTN